MSEEKPNLRYRSTGKPVFETEPEDGGESLREARRQQNPAFRRQQALDEIRRNRAATDKSPDERYKEAIKRFDYRYPDIAADSGLVLRAVQEHNAAIERAGKRGEVLDWDKTLTEIGENIRKNAGLPSEAEQSHQQALDDMRRSRGQGGE